MVTHAARTPSAAQQQSLPDGWLDGILERIEALHAKGNLDAVRDQAVILAKKHAQTQQRITELCTVQEAQRAKLKAMVAPEHYAVTVTSVERNGSLLAEVAGLGNSRVQVGVHPDVDPAELVVGATAMVSSERNCLLKVTSPTGRWHDVGTFDRYLESSDRILVRDKETLKAVDLAPQLRDTPLKKNDLIGFDGEVSGIAYQRLETPKGEHLFDEHVTDDFSMLGGLDTVIAKIKTCIDFRFRYPHLAEKYALKSKSSILLEGLPGNGKTRLARCCAGYLRQQYPGRPCRFMHVAGSSDYSMWFGEAERRIRERFNAIREAAEDGLVVLFWDEVDAIAKLRGSDHGSGAPDRILNTFLSELDGVIPLANVLILFATNRADTLDPGFVRPGRIDEKIVIPPPNRRAAHAILNCYLGRGLPLAAAHESTDELVTPLLSRLYAPNGMYAKVAQVKLSDGRHLPVAGHQLLSGAMLENVVRIASSQAAVREAETGQEGLTAQDLGLVLETELAATVSLLAPGNVKNYVKSIPQDAQPIAVEPLLIRPASTYTRSS